MNSQGTINEDNFLEREMSGSEGGSSYNGFTSGILSAYLFLQICRENIGRTILQSLKVGIGKRIEVIQQRSHVLLIFLSN